MDTVHDTREDEAVFADLFDGNADEIRRALETLGDDDLLMAALVINSQPIYPGRDELHTAVRLAALVANAKTAGGAMAISQAVFEVVRPWLVIVALGNQTGIFESGRLHGIQDLTAEMVEARVAYTADLPCGGAFLDAALRAEVRRAGVNMWNRSDFAVMRALIKRSTDVNLIHGALRVIPMSDQTRGVVIERLFELKATDALDEIARKPEHQDSWTRTAIAGASIEVARELSATSDLSFIARKAALLRLEDHEVLEIFRSSPHRNVRDSASEELSRRGISAE